MTDSANEIAMNIILHAGNAKFNFTEALQSIKCRDIAKVKDLLEEANIELIEAHKYQTKMLQAEATGANMNPNILLVHAQDHLTMATICQETIESFIDLYEIVQKIEDNINV